MSKSERLLLRMSVKQHVTRRHISEGSRGGLRVGTVELQHPLLKLDIIDNM
jgi:hypothetical protein